MFTISNIIKLLEPRGVPAKVSSATGISTGNISDWKSGRSRPTLEALVLLSDYFNVSTDYLLGIDTPAQPLSSDVAELMELIKDLPKEDILYLKTLVELMRARK